jgi:hypothetical protein
MLSRPRPFLLALMLLTCAVCAPVSAKDQGAVSTNPGAASAVCEELRNEINYYYELYQKGGTTKQLEVWKKLRRKYVQKYNQTACPRFHKKIVLLSRDPTLYPVVGKERFKFAAV